MRGEAFSAHPGRWAAVSVLPTPGLIMSLDCRAVGQVTGQAAPERLERIGERPESTMKDRSDANHLAHLSRLREAHPSNANPCIGRVFDGSSRQG